MLVRYFGISLGIFSTYELVPSVYPDHGKILLPSTETYSFRASSRYMQNGKISEKISGCSSCPQVR